ncbi:MAG: 23S rRNA (adenine(2503)-C(2))-methyltransferase RlmN [Myxococcales bacterium]|nr:23S rRNA (adenine(2503)-C(2))-methyltransferase RlmN [Myxococcales bacterium]
MGGERPPARDADGRILLKGLSREALRAWVDARGGSPQAAARIWAGLYRHRLADLAELPGVDPELRRRLADEARVDALTLDEVREAADGTRKLVFRTDDGALIESVLIPGDRRATLCISSQIGCAMGCHFCLTAKLGLRGDLSTAEIVDQVVIARRLFGDARPISNVVFMGMGEPLHNPDAVIPATHTLCDPEGLDLSSRRVTVSTSGLVPAIERLGAESPARLAVSLNATTDAVRDWLMPVNRKYPLAALLGALRRFPLRARDRIVIEYVLLAGINDQADDIERLAGLLRGIACKVNLIAFNPHPGSELRRPSDAHVLEFQAELRRRGVATAIRRTRGDEAMAACGQLGRAPAADAPRRRRSLPIAATP